MATDTFKSPQQAYPAANTLTALYTVPGATTASVSSVVCCNQGSREAKVRVSVGVAGAADESKQYLFFDVIVPANDSFVATIGGTLGAADVVRVQSDTGQVSFSLFCVEFS